MSTATTLKLPDALRAKIVPLAQESGKSPHAWMVEALEAQAALAEMRRAFITEAQASAADIDAGGPLYAMEDVHRYLRSLAVGKKAARPKPITARRARTPRR